MKTYRRCRQAYHLKYVEKLRAKRKSRPLTFGSIVHRMIELEAEGEDFMDALKEFDIQSMALFGIEKAEYAQILQDAATIMEEYFIFWGDQPDRLTYDRIKGKSAEHSFDIEILPDIVWNGKIDARGKSKGLRWLIEHKTFNRRPNDDDRWRNLQSVSYFKAFEILGWPQVDGTCWDYVWSKPPMVPKLLSDGSLSQATKIDTLPSTVEQAIRDNKLKKGDYSKLIKDTEDGRSKWFQRVFTRVDQDVKDLVFNDFLETIKEMAENHGKKRDMNIERHCSWCEFEPLCRAKMQGLDYDFIKERNYEKSEGPSETADHIVELED